MSNPLWADRFAIKLSVNKWWKQKELNLRCFLGIALQAIATNQQLPYFQIKWLQRSDLNWWFPTYEDGDVATGLRCKMVCSTGLEPVSFALQASAMTPLAKNTWWSIRESNSFTISLQKKSAAHSYTPNKMEPNIRIKRMTYCLQGSCSIAELIGHGRGSRTRTYKTTVKV